MALSMLVTLNGTIMSGARVPFAVARDGYFFRALAEVHPRFHTPSVAIVVQAVIVDSAVAAGCEFSAAFFAGDFCRVALLHDRRQHDLCLSRTRAAGGASISHVGLSFRAGGVCGGGGGICLCYTFKNDWPNSGYGMLVILAGIPVFGYFSAAKAAQLLERFAAENAANHPNNV